MSFLDPYDIAGTGTGTPPQQPEQSLNEEVTQVIGQLGRFWGGFRKQSQTVLESARKDFGSVVTQAQKELGLTDDSSKDASSQEKAASGPSDSGSLPETASASSSTSTLDTTPSGSTQTLFARLQSALPPNLVSTVQNNIPETLKHASEGIDIGQLRTTISSEFHRVQGATIAQAEGYVPFIKEAVREAGEVAGEVWRDALKVIPPEEAGSSSNVGVVWDGTDIWTLPFETSDGASGKGKGRDSGPSSGRPSGEAQRAVATRAESLLKRLRHDPEILKHDPESDPRAEELYRSWLETEVEVKGGIEGEEWTKKLADELEETTDGAALQANHDTLVPSVMTNDIFWKRYFFRVHQIESEEAKRKALIEATTEKEDDFSWEDDEEELGPPPAPVAASSLPQTVDSDHSTITEPSDSAAKLSAPSSRARTPADGSPRESSEESYDLVSSGNVSATGEGKVNSKDDTDDHDGDSDWE